MSLLASFDRLVRAKTEYRRISDAYPDVACPADVSDAVWLRRMREQADLHHACWQRGSAAEQDLLAALRCAQPGTQDDGSRVVVTHEDVTSKFVPTYRRTTIRLFDRKTRPKRAHRRRDLIAAVAIGGGSIAFIKWPGCDVVDEGQVARTAAEPGR